MHMVQNLKGREEYKKPVEGWVFGLLVKMLVKLLHPHLSAYADDLVPLVILASC